MSHLHTVSELETHLIEMHGVSPMLIAEAYTQVLGDVDEIAVLSHDFMHGSGVSDHVHEDAELYTATE
jgi:hypothetical protein